MKATLTLEKPSGIHEADTTAAYVQDAMTLHLRHSEAASNIIITLQGLFFPSVVASSSSQNEHMDSSEEEAKSELLLHRKAGNSAR